MQIKNILATKGMQVITIRPEQTLRDVVTMLSERRIGALVVVDGAGKPVGIISERDIIRTASHDDKFFGRQVKEAMTTAVIFGSPNDDVHSVEKTMTERHFRHLPIVEDGKLTGMISIRDIIKALLGKYEGEIDTLQTVIKG